MFVLAMSSAFLVLPYQAAALFNAFSSNLCSLATTARYCLILQIFTAVIVYPICIKLWLATGYAPSQPCTGRTAP